MQHRVERVSKLIRERIAEIIAREMKDPRVELLEITAVKLTPDLREARIFFRQVGDQERRREAEAALFRARGFLQGQLAQRLGLKTAPIIAFEYDTTLDEANRIEQLLEKVKSE